MAAECKHKECWPASVSNPSTTARKCISRTGIFTFFFFFLSYVLKKPVKSCIYACPCYIYISSPYSSSICYHFLEICASTSMWQDTNLLANYMDEETKFARLNLILHKLLSFPGANIPYEHSTYSTVQAVVVEWLAADWVIADKSLNMMSYIRWWAQPE